MESIENMIEDNKATAKTDNKKLLQTMNDKISKVNSEIVNKNS